MYVNMGQPNLLRIQVTVSDTIWNATLPMRPARHITEIQVKLAIAFDAKFDCVKCVNSHVAELTCNVSLKQSRICDF